MGYLEAIKNRSLSCAEDQNKSRPVNMVVMPRERFKFFLRYLRFDECTSRLVRLKTDKLVTIRFVFENI